MYFNPILSTDGYKPTHWKQYPPGTSKIYSYYESRGGLYPECVFFGLNNQLRRHLPAHTSQSDISTADLLLKHYFGHDYLNREGWDYLASAYKYKPLPLVIKAVPEGTVVPIKNVMMTVENTDPKLYWLTNYIETMLCQVWYPITVATVSREIKKTLAKGLRDTGADMAGLDFMLHDFGMRAATCMEAAAIGGAAHLINFKGTDTLPTLEFINDEYTPHGEWNFDTGFSVPASEHSTMTSWGREHELDAYANMLDAYPEGAVSVVSDSYDIFKACEYMWGVALKEKVLNRKGTLVVRPDSGPPAETLVQVFEKLSHAFGYTENEKGYKLLPPQVRMLWGDGIDHKEIKKIIRVFKKEHISLGNIAAFGMGGGLIQKVNRDTQMLAFKCSWAEVNGEGRDVYKEPVTGSGKKSKRGRLKLVKDDKGQFLTVPESDPRPDEMVTVYDPENGLADPPSFAEIRERAKLCSSR
jgi:nicotinamide phosphoribosyltransferase